MAQEAYNFARFESAAEPAPRKENTTRLHSVKGGGQKNAVLQKMFGNVIQVAMVVLFFTVAIALVQSEVKLNEYTRQIQLQSDELLTQQSKYSYLESSLNTSVNLEQVEKVAKEIGLVKVDESQITYIRLEDEAVLRTMQSTLEQWKATAQGTWAELVEWLTP
ncbi:MAG: hypothetical protein R3Y06_05095 [Faecalibacterium sp.]